MRSFAPLAMACAAGLFALTISARAEEPAGPLGPWLTEDGSAVVQIAACGSALCGNIIWSQKATDAKGHALCGQAILGDLVSLGSAGWGKGWIYSPRMESKYPVAAVLTTDGKLQLHVSAGLLGKDQTWTRPTAALTPCNP